MCRKPAPVEATICVSPDAAAGSPPAIASARPALSRKTIASITFGEKPLWRAARTMNGR